MTLYCAVCHEPLDVTQADEDAWETHPCDCYARPFEELISDSKFAAKQMQDTIDHAAERKGAISYVFQNALNALNEALAEAEKAL